MNTIIINGTRMEVEGNNISVVNDTVMVSGVVIKSGLSGVVEIKFEGDLASLECHNAEVKGNIQGDVDCHNLNCGNIGGNVSAHSITCTKN